MNRTAMALLTALASSGCWDVPAGDKTSPYFWSKVFLDKYADELVVGDLEPGPAPLAEPRTVLLITGVTIRTQWFDPIVARLERDGFVPVVYEPPELLSGSLFQAAEELAQVVEQVRSDSGQAKIDILAECTGGVIARHYIQSLGGQDSVSRLVTFVSPHAGIDKAPLAAAIAGWPALDDLSPGSAFLNAVNNAPLPEGVPVTSIYTCTDEYITPYQTAIVPGATNIGLCDGFVGHFQTFYDPSIYLVMHAALTAPLPSVEEPEEPAPLPDVHGSAPETEPAEDVAAEPTLEEPVEAEVKTTWEAMDPPEDDEVSEAVIELSAKKRRAAGQGCAAGDGYASRWGLAALALALLLIRRRMTALGRSNLTS